MTPTPAVLPASFQHLSLAAGVRAAMTRDPAKVACRHGSKTRTYAELVDRIDRVSAFLGTGIGLAPGQHGAIVARNSIEYLEIVIGASQAGIALATVNPRLAVPEIVAICNDARALVLFADAEYAEALRDCRFESVRHIIVIGDELTQQLGRARPAAIPRNVAEWDTFTIPYTSGTTGKPKGVLVSHRSRILTLFGMAVEYGCYGPDDRFLAIAPMCHGAGMVFSLAPIFFGGHAEIIDRFEPELVMRRLGEAPFTGFFGVPTHFHSMMSLGAAQRDAARDNTLRTVISNAAAMPQPMKEVLVDYFGPGRLHETYGSTEAGIVSNLRPPDQIRKVRCVGQPFPCTQVEVRRPDGRICDIDEVGELFSSSPYLFNGYFGRPEDTAEAFQDGWVSVGDLARRDAEGYLYIVDRKKDMVISGGVNIYPREVEDVLLRHPAVADVAIIGVPDDKWGEVLKAFVVCRPGQSLDPAAISDWCSGQVSRMKVPKHFDFLGEIPRNANGKVLKTALRDRVR